MMYIVRSVRFAGGVALCASLLLIGCTKDEGTPKKPKALDQAALEKAAQKGVQEAARQEAARLEEARQEAARLEEAKEEAAKLQAAKKEAIEKAVKPPAALAMFQTELEKGSAQLSALQVALQALVEDAAGDLDAHHETFEKELAATKSLAESLRKRKEDMTARGTAYFELWEKQLAAMKTAAVKELAEKRREELAKDYGDLIASTQLTGDAYDFYMNQLKEIQEALDDDLSEKTVKALAPKIEKAGQQCETVRNRIAAGIEKLGKIAGIYAGT